MDGNGNTSTTTTSLGKDSTASVGITIPSKCQVLVIGGGPGGPTSSTWSNTWAEYETQFADAVADMGRMRQEVYEITDRFLKT